jgi:hypothetical protein
MSKRNKDFFQGLFIGLIAPLIGFYFFVNLVLKTDIEPAYHQLIKDDLFTQVVSISLLLNLLVVFVFFKRQEDRKIQGVIGAVILYALYLSVQYFL